MSNDKDIRAEIKEQKSKFKELSLSGKFRYIWDYYKLHILVVILGIVFVTTFVISMIRVNYDHLCMIAVIDGKIDGSYDNTDALTTGFTEFLGIDGQKQRIDLDYANSLIIQDMDNEAYETMQKLYVKISTSEIDGWLITFDKIEMLSSPKNPILLDLRDFFSEEELEILSDALIYYTRENGESFPFAVDLTYSDIVNNSGLNMEHPCYGIVTSGRHPKCAANFIRYCFDLNKTDFESA